MPRSDYTVCRNVWRTNIVKWVPVSVCAVGSCPRRMEKRRVCWWISAISAKRTTSNRWGTMMKFVLVDYYSNCQPEIYWIKQSAKPIVRMHDMTAMSIIITSAYIYTIHGNKASSIDDWQDTDTLLPSLGWVLPLSRGQDSRGHQFWYSWMEEWCECCRVGVSQSGKRLENGRLDWPQETHCR